MDIGLGVSEDIPPDAQRHIAREVEGIGLHSLWTNEARGRDALLVCANWAAATSHLRVGVGVVPVWARSPAQLGMAAATLQETSRGRFLLGVGVSHPATMDPWHGADYRRPLDAAGDTLAILRELFAGESTDHEGAVFSSRGLRLAINPLPAPPPVYLAAMGPRMLELAAHRADGVLLNWSSPETVGESVATIRSAAAAAPDGRSPARVEVASYARVAVDDDAGAARDALAREVSAYCALPAYAEHFARQGFEDGVAAIRSAYREGGTDAAVDAVPESMLSSLGWYGRPDETPTDLISRFAAAGLDHLVVRVVVSGNDAVASVERVLEALSRTPLTAPG